jgi:hypothetical protein
VDYKPLRKKEKVIILGAGHTWEQAPIDDPECEVWMLNAFFRNAWRGEKVSCDKYATRWFQLHQPGSTEGHIDDLDSIAWMKKWNRGPIYMVNKFPDYPASVRYPFEEVTRRMGPYDYLKQRRRAYFTNSVDYMVTLAAVEGFKEIGLFGVSMISDVDHEWAEQRTSLSYYLGKVEAMGIKLIVPRQAGILRAPWIYGFEEQPHHINQNVRYWEQYRQKCHDKMDEHRDRYGTAKALMHRGEGSTLTLQEIVGDVKNGFDKKALLEKYEEMLSRSEKTTERWRKQTEDEKQAVWQGEGSIKTVQAAIRQWKMMERGIPF